MPAPGRALQGGGAILIGGVNIQPAPGKKTLRRHMPISRRVHQRRAAFKIRGGNISAFLQ